ncbi:MAG: ABC transporter substrate-binding protein [Dehalococcoidales bacterium]|nr:ABC transporter substrate-binding protein [Dehalococcoidales bacterium]
MKKKFIWVVVSGLVVVSMLLAACAPAATTSTTPTAPVTPAAPATPVTPATPTAPVTPALPTGSQGVVSTPSLSPAVQRIETGTTTETVKVTLKKNDGTMVVKDYVKPKYGGLGRYSRPTAILAWDELFLTPWTIMNYLHTNEALVQGDWARGPAGTGEVAYQVGGWVRLDYVYGMLAESWEFPDDTTAIFHIRKGVRYALDPNSEASRLVNGREFTADDVVYNVKRIYIDNPSSPMGGMATVSRPTDVYATDKYTVVLKAPKGQLGKTWEYVSDWSFMIAPEVVKKYGDANSWERVVGTGPFILTDYVPMSAATWKRNPNYWMNDPLMPENQLPYLDSLKQYVIPDRSTNLAALRTGKIDWLLTQTGEEGKQIINSRSEIQYKENRSSAFYALHCRLDKSFPWNDIRVRRALLMAYNQEEVVATYFAGLGQIIPSKVENLDIFKDVWTPIDKLPLSADGFDNRKLYRAYVYPNISKDDKAGQNAAYLAEAKKLLADAGYPNGFKVKGIANAGDPLRLDQMIMLQGYWAKIGVELILDSRENAVFTSMQLKKSHDEAITGGRWAGEPYSMFMVRANNTWDWAMVNNPVFEDYYNKITSLYFDPVARDKMTKEMNLATIDYIPFYVFPSGYAYDFWWPWVHNFDDIQSLDVGGYYYPKYMWIDQTLKKSMGY